MSILSLLLFIIQLLNSGHSVIGIIDARNTHRIDFIVSWSSPNCAYVLPDGKITIQDC